MASATKLADISLSQAMSSLQASATERLKPRSLAALLAAAPSTSTAAASADSNGFVDGYSDSDSDTAASSRLSVCKKASQIRDARSKFGRCLHSGDELSTESGDESLVSFCAPSSAYDTSSVASGDESSSLPCGKSSDVDDDDDFLDAESDMASRPSGPTSDVEDDVEFFDAPQLVYSREALLSLRKASLTRGVAPVLTVTYGIQPKVPSKDVSKRLPPCPNLAPCGDQEAVAKLTRSALAVLGWDKFDAAYDNLIRRGIKSPLHLSVVLGQVLGGAAEAPRHLVPKYVDLCVRLRADVRVKAAIGPDGSPDSFRQILLNHLWPAFEHLVIAPGQQSCGIANRRAIGSVETLGEFVARGVLGPRFALECAEAFLRSLEAWPLRLEVLEPLAAVLRSTCPVLCSIKNWTHSKRLNAVLVRVSELAANSAVPLCERSLLQASLCSATWLERDAPAVVSQTRGLARRCTSAIPQSTPEMLSLSRCLLLSTSTGSGAKGGNAKDSVSASRLGRTITGTTSTYCHLQPVGRSSCTRALDLAPPQVLAPAPKLPQPKPQGAPQQNERRALAAKAPFCPVSYRRALSAALAELRVHHNVALTVGTIREQGVPLTLQGAEFADILTRVAEISYKPERILAFAFAAGLAAEGHPDGSAFDRALCLQGVELFFRDVYAGLREDVPSLPAIVRRELLPTLRSVLPKADLDRQVPKELLREIGLSFPSTSTTAASFKS